MGCLFAERFDHPVLLTAQEDGALVALGLFNCRANLIGAARLHLGEAGSAALDAPYIEHNGFLGRATPIRSRHFCAPRASPGWTDAARSGRAGWC